MPKFPSIQDPAPTPESLRQSILQIKEAVEILTRQRRPVTSGAVTWQDLVDLELIAADQVPKR